MTGGVGRGGRGRGPAHGTPPCRRPFRRSPRVSRERSNLFKRLRRASPKNVTPKPPRYGLVLTWGSSCQRMGYFFILDLRSNYEPGIGRGVCSPTNLTFGRRSRRLHQASAFGGRGFGERNQSKAAALQVDGRGRFVRLDRPETASLRSRPSRRRSSSSTLGTSAMAQTGSSPRLKAIDVRSSVSLSIRSVLARRRRAVAIDAASATRLSTPSCSRAR